MRCLNHCPERAIEASHGMAIVFWIIYTAVNAQIFLLIINLFHIQPEIWWWRIASNIIGIGGMIIVSTFLYRIFHSAMGLKPVRYLFWFISLTALPFWKRYLPRKKNKTLNNSV
jgi:hypothetical protein